MKALVFYKYKDLYSAAMEAYPYSATVADLQTFYYKIVQSDKALVQKAGATVLGLMGRKLPDFLAQEVDRNFDSTSDDIKIRLLTAIFMVPYKPYRHPDFNHPKKYLVL